MAIAIHPYNHKDGAFSAVGDSGSIVVNGLGRIAGLLTSGSGSTDVMMMMDSCLLVVSGCGPARDSRQERPGI
jgi:hypothetical protein